MDARIVWSRAAGKRWKPICCIAGLGRTAAWERWVMGLCVIAMKLNGARIPKQPSRLRAMATIMRSE